jgi:hypothetical protein
MDELDYFTLKELRNSIEESIRELEKDIIDYSTKANDEEVWCNDSESNLL